MPIEPAAFASVSLSSAGRAVIEILNQPPNTTSQINPPETPGKLVGYYNPTTDKVQLYIASSAGVFWIRVG